MSPLASSYKNWLQPQLQPPHSLRKSSWPRHNSPIPTAAVLHNGVDRGALCFVSTSVGMCPQLAPGKNVHWVEVRASRRPAVLEMKLLVFSYSHLMDLLGDRTWAEFYCQTQGLSPATTFTQEGSVYSVSSICIDPEAIFKEIEGASHQPP